MRILLVAHQFVDTNRRGVELNTYYLSRALQADHEVAVFHASRNGPAHGFDQRAVDGVATFVVGVHGQWQEALTRAAQPDSEAAFEEVLKAWQPDVVHFQQLIHHSLRFPAIAKRFGSATAFNLNDFWLLCPQIQLLDHRRRISWPIDRRNCARCCLARTGRTYSWRRLWGWDPLLLGRRAALEHYLRHRRPQMVARMADDVDVFLAPSRDVARRFVERGFPAERIVHCPYGIDVGLRPAGYVRPAMENGLLRCAFLGGFLPHKGLDVLVEAFRGIEGARLRVYGRPPRGHGNGGLGPHIEIAGEIGEAEKPEMFGQTDVLIVPSIWPEVSGIVILEAFLFGVPVVASDIGGMPELVEEGRNGALFRTGDAEDLRRRIMRFVEDRAELRRLATNAPPVRSVADQARDVAAVYERVLDGRESARRRKGTVAWSLW